MGGKLGSDFVQIAISCLTASGERHGTVCAPPLVLFSVQNDSAEHAKGPRIPAASQSLWNLDCSVGGLEKKTALLRNPLRGPWTKNWASIIKSTNHVHSRFVCSKHIAASGSAAGPHQMLHIAPRAATGTLSYADRRN